MVYGTGISLMCCKSGEYLGKLILPYLNKFLKQEHLSEIGITKTHEQQFINTEIKSNILTSIRGNDVYIVQDVTNQSFGYSINDNVLALKTLINSARISNASRINVIIPTYPYARQDKSFDREGITAKMFAKELEVLGVNTIITLDIHNPATSGFFEKAIFENLKGFRDLIKYVSKNLDSEKLVISSPDLGGIKRAKMYSEFLKRDLVTIYKERSYTKIDSITDMQIIGVVKNKDVLLVDDMLDTGGTAYNSIKLLKENGANNIYFICSLPFLNGKAVERMNELYKNGSLKKVVGTNAVYHSPEFLEKNPWFEQVHLESYFAKVIFNMYTSKSISGLLKDIKY